ncbi:helix-turn-helix domain-containing protein [Microbulbifer elongatus]|uniref:Helix-turn-helix domain-containing protein n=1 Tax=Microbulbifer elongatus TaxID=86173 RepID=A0ABT1P4G9_9GAMM|nr:helix-turn-helix domain-containing protein [Microbulbifer elongatus]MCQ3831006.1 helix-turn-helix domain-containing protein [Microbulbifer elongatus]
MGKIVIDWYVVFHNIVPIISAQFFLVALIYFTLVRERLGREYPYYALFLTSFIIYLASTFINILPIQGAALYIHYLGSFLLFSVGFPSLLTALFIKSELHLPPALRIGSYALGVLWSMFYLVTADYQLDKVNILTSAGDDTPIPKWLNFDNAYFFQSLVIVAMLILPGIYLWLCTKQNEAKPYIFGMLVLAAFAFIGSSVQQWAIYYAGSSICAIAWAWATFNDIRNLNDQLKAHNAHSKVVASAQYASRAGNISISELYPDSLDESYPFREREDLLEAIRTSSSGLVEPRAQELVSALYSFSKQNEDVLKARVREAMYFLVDTCIYLGGDAKPLILRLEDIGAAIDRCDGQESMAELISTECLYLTKSISSLTRPTGVDALVERIKSYVLAHYHKDTMSISSISEAVGVSKSHAMKSFKAKYGITLNQYIVETRMEKAKSYLLVHSVTETAYEVGFKNASYFSTFFRKHAGITPKQFKQQALKESEG